MVYIVSTFGVWISVARTTTNSRLRVCVHDGKHMVMIRNHIQIIMRIAIICGTSSHFRSRVLVSPFNAGPRAARSTNLYVWSRFVACLAASTSILEYGTTSGKTCRVIPPSASSLLRPRLSRNSATQQQQHYCNGKKGVFAPHSTICILLLLCLLHPTAHTFTIYKDTVFSLIVQVLFTLCRRVQRHFVTAGMKYLYAKKRGVLLDSTPRGIYLKVDYFICPPSVSGRCRDRQGWFSPDCR